ncbi:hypothetical protein IEQ34_015685 [Dendrobium chrysotoxum]|uniref:NADH:quinone oxidoreductase/Mrp antiporter transmembrane domain-containing protein n=1 Tax=Dendrobium chrysotoxum TaxID=161865 RepID=A0AAV7GIX5_DENCH|nr:hypothetical protein IEQ34_015685 [Dendrobium chrysotoxum]
MGGASSSILIHGLSWLYGLSWGGEFNLQEIVNGIGFKISLAPFHQWTLDKEVRNSLFDSDYPTPVVAFLFVTLKVATSALATYIFYFSSTKWHLLLEILAIISIILGNLILLT